MRARDETDASGRAESERNMHTTIAIKTQRLSCHATCVRWWLSTSAGEQISKRKKQACGLHGQQKRNTNRITASAPWFGCVLSASHVTRHSLSLPSVRALLGGSLPSSLPSSVRMRRLLPQKVGTSGRPSKRACASTRAGLGHVTMRRSCPPLRAPGKRRTRLR